MKVIGMRWHNNNNNNNILKKFYYHYSVCDANRIGEYSLGDVTFFEEDHFVSTAVSPTPTSIFLDLIPIAYLLFFVVLIYVLMKLHARNTYVTVLLLKPFNKCVFKVQRSFIYCQCFLHIHSSFSFQSSLSFMVLIIHAGVIITI